MLCNWKRILLLTGIICIASVVLLFSCASRSGGVATETPFKGNQGSSSSIHNAQSLESNQGTAGSAGSTSSAVDASKAPSGSEDPQTPEHDAALAKENASFDIRYPTGWLIAPYDGIDAGTPVEILYLPGFSVVPHGNGDVLSASRMQSLAASIPDHDDENALVRQDGMIVELSPDYLLVNLPDVLAQAEYDVVYSYSSTSNCDGIPIPGITNERIVGYPNGKQPNAYLGSECYIVPCAYRTAEKLIAVSSALNEAGYKLLVYDAYRPMRAQWALADSIEDAYMFNPDVQSVLGEWSINWYVANGPSGHNFGTDLDVGLCDLNGARVAMPSAYDTFGGSGHLTAYQLDASSITPDSYADEVLNNSACMTLHSVFVSAGFSELASEWWHFADSDTEYIVRSIVGGEGLDYAIEAVS